MPYASLHAVAVKTARDGADALKASLAALARMLDAQIREADSNLDGFRLLGISHAHTMAPTDNGLMRAVVSGIASYKYT